MAFETSVRDASQSQMRTDIQAINDKQLRMCTKKKKRGKGYWGSFQAMEMHEKKGLGYWGLFHRPASQNLDPEWSRLLCRKGPGNGEHSLPDFAASPLNTVSKTQQHHIQRDDNTLTNTDNDKKPMHSRNATDRPNTSANIVNTK